MDGEDKRYLGSSRAVFLIRAGLTFVVYTAIMALMTVFLYRMLHKELSTEGAIIFGSIVTMLINQARNWTLHWRGEPTNGKAEDNILRRQ